MSSNDFVRAWAITGIAVTGVLFFLIPGCILWPLAIPLAGAAGWLVASLQLYVLSDLLPSPNRWARINGVSWMLCTAVALASVLFALFQRPQWISREALWAVGSVLVVVGSSFACGLFEARRLFASSAKRTPWTVLITLAHTCSSAIGFGAALWAFNSWHSWLGVILGFVLAGALYGLFFALALSKTISKP